MIFGAGQNGAQGFLGVEFGTGRGAGLAEVRVDGLHPLKLVVGQFVVEYRENRAIGHNRLLWNVANASTPPGCGEAVVGKHGHRTGRVDRVTRRDPSDRLASCATSAGAIGAEITTFRPSVVTSIELSGTASIGRAAPHPLDLGTVEFAPRNARGLQALTGRECLRRSVPTAGKLAQAAGGPGPRRRGRCHRPSTRPATAAPRRNRTCSSHEAAALIEDHHRSQSPSARYRRRGRSACCAASR